MRLTLDLTRVRLIDSTALGMIVWLYKEVQERGGRVCVTATRPLTWRRSSARNARRWPRS